MEELVKFLLLTRDIAPYLVESLQRAQGERSGTVGAGEPGSI